MKFNESTQPYWKTNVYLLVKIELMNIKNIALFSLLIVLLSCSLDNDDGKITIDVAVPVTMELSEFRKSVDVLPPEPTKKTGKIYVYQEYIFIMEVDKGIHVIDNTNPSNPLAISFIEIPANEDISIKGGFLYADSAVDLVVFNISDINNIQIENRLLDVFSRYDYHVPVEVERADYSNFNYATEVIVGWDVVQKEVNEEEFNWSWARGDVLFVDAALDASGAESSVGVGGSLAKFQIHEDYLYTVGNYDMSIFNISNLS